MRSSSRFLVAALLPFAATAIHAVELGPVGPRSVAMGGTGVATANDALAATHNPAFLATSPRIVGEGSDARPAGRYGMNVVDFSMGITLAGEIGDYLDTLANVDINTLSGTNTLTEQQIQDAWRLSTALAGVDNPGNGLIANAGAGGAIRWGKLSIGARMRGQAGVRVDELDRNNLGLSNLNITGINTELTNLSSGQTGTTLTQAQKDALTNTGLGGANVDYLDFILTDLVSQGLVSEGDVQDAVELLVDVVEQSDLAGGDLADNTTVVTGRAIGIAEIPIAYGYAITPELSVGATLRLMMGRVYGTTVLVFDDDNDEVLDSIDENYETTATATVDVGIRFQYQGLTLAAIGRNLTKPSFDGLTTTTGAVIADVELEPQVTVGAAYQLPSRLTITVEADVLENESMLRGLDEQYVRAGIEWDPIRMLELRVGAWNNIAQSELDWMLTGGIGLDFGLVRFDLAGGVSPFDTVRYDGDSYPQAAHVSFGISAGF